MSSEFLLCTVLDLGAEEACDPFLAKTMPVLWRNVDQLMSKATVSKAEFVVVVLGTFLRESGYAVVSVPQYFSVDRVPLDSATIESMKAAIHDQR